MLLAVGLSKELARQAQRQGLAVFTLPGGSNLQDFADAALNLRRRDPYCPLWAIPDAAWHRQFQQRYPALSDRIMTAEELG